MACSRDSCVSVCMCVCVCHTGDIVPIQIGEKIVAMVAEITGARYDTHTHTHTHTERHAMHDSSTNTCRHACMHL